MSRKWEKINKEFDKFFKLMFDGGKAQLKLMKQEPRLRPDFAKATTGRQGFGGKQCAYETKLRTSSYT